jgi:ApbE superfamily uncharacterized protein (UPF0280 family)
MKSSEYQRRFYRDWVKAKSLYLSQFTEKETDLQILTDQPIDKTFLRQRIRYYRWQIEKYISRDPRFLTSLKPVAVELNAAPIIKRMSAASQAANVGPMAAVAGAIAEYLGRDLLKQGCLEVIIENGGDIFLKLKETRKIGLYAGREKLGRSIILKVSPENTPLGICTSSGVIGHSLSFGQAESAMVLAKNVALADAVATAVGNRVKTKNDLKPAVEFARSIKGVSGVVIILKNNLISWGKTLELCG